MHTWGTFSLNTTRYFIWVLLFIVALLFWGNGLVHAATIQTYSDTLSDSGPGAYSNHTLQFTTTTEIPTGGYVRFRPSPGDFTIPSSINFDFDNVELLVSTSSGFFARQASSTANATYDGVSITTGTSGQIEVTLNSTQNIPAGATVRMLIGDHTSNATGTDIAITNPSATTSFPIFFETGGTVDESVQGWIAIVDKVQTLDVDTTETIPPVRFNGAPSGELSGTVVQVQLSLETDEFARCRYSTATGTPYFSMSSEFNTNFTTIHTKVITVATNTVYRFFVRCIDDENNFNTDDYIITFSVPEYPDGTPGASGDDEGEGEGTGEGSGSADPGDGDPNGEDDSSGGSSGGGGGGGGGGGSGTSSGGDDGSGGFEGTDRPYQSGDARVIINGYAFPRSAVVVLVDGAIAEQSTADAAGKFSVTIDEIARGVYTFGVYAVDRNGTKSSTFSTTFSVIGSKGSTLSNVNVMPSIVVNPDPADPDSTVNFSGYSIPNATITIENQNDRSSIGLKTFTTNSDSNGAWSLDVSTSGFTTGTYKVRAKAKQDSGVSTEYSGFTYYGVGEESQAPRSSDLNRDGSVNLIDFSILLFWWNSDGGASDPPADINNDGTVSLTDFSIMIFNWTG